MISSTSLQGYSNLKSIIFVVLLFFTPLHSSEWMAELRGSYFYPTSTLFQDIYRDGGFEGEIEVLRTFTTHWIGWGNINYFRRDGYSKGIQDKTTIHMVPLSLGVKYQFPCYNSLSPYLGAGITYTFVNIKNDSPFVRRNVSKSGVGFVLKSGTYLTLTENFFLDLFVDYYYQKMQFYKTSKTDLGGFKIGIGLGY